MHIYVLSLYILCTLGIMVLLKGNLILTYSQRVAIDHLQVILAILVMCMWVPGRLIFACNMLHVPTMCACVVDLPTHVCHEYPE